MRALEETVSSGASITELQRRYGYDLSEYRLTNKRQILRNCVAPQLGKHILNIVEDINLTMAEPLPTNRELPT